MQNGSIKGFRLSPQQKHLWKLQRETGNAAYRADCAVLIEGVLDLSILKAALHDVVARHEILRTSFRSLPGMTIPLQVINAGRIDCMRIDDVSALNQRDKEDHINELLREAARLKFDLERGAVLRFWLARLSADSNLLVISLPALCSDLEALKNLLHEISRSYDALLQGGLPFDPPLQYADLAELQNEVFETSEGEPGIEYWRRQDLSGLASMRLPFHIDDQRKQTFEPHLIVAPIDADTSAKLNSLINRLDVSRTVFFLACWHVLLWRLTAEADVITGVNFDGRNYQQLEDTLGLFAKYLPIRSHITEGCRLSKLLAQIDESVRNAYDWQECFSPELVERSNEDPLLPLFSSSFDFVEEFSAHSASGVKFSLYNHYVCFDRFDVKLSCVRRQCGFITEFYYDSSLFSPDEIRRLAGQFQTLLSSVIKAPEAAVAELESLSAVERQQLLIDFNSTSINPPPIKRIHELFEIQVEKTPESVAIAFEGYLSYAELNTRANQLAHYLRMLGVAPEVRVAICLQRSPDVLVAMLGILKAGGAYVPLEPSLPKQRLAFMLEKSGAGVLLTQSQLLDRFSDGQAEVFCFDKDWNIVASQSRENPENLAAHNNLAYVLFTSGSTGGPKGVAVEHQQLVNYVSAIVEKLKLPPRANFATVSTFSADLGNTVIFPSLFTGGCLHIMSEETVTDAEAMASYFGHHFIDCLKIVPSHLSALLTSSKAEQMLPRHCLVLGGESCDLDLLERVAVLAPDCTIINHYGPTETTVGVLSYRADRTEAKIRYSTLPIGRPLANTRVYLLDNHQHPVPIGVPGELHIAGAGLSRGYLNRPDITGGKFIPNPFSETSGERLYRTGDLARFLPEGNLEFLGRVDDQVKVRGIRIELGEIESELKKQRGIQDAVVLARTYAPGDKRLEAYLVPDLREASVVRRLLRLENEGVFANRSRYELPNRMVIAHKNKNETDFMFKEIFEEKVYLKYGITLDKDSCVFDVGANIGMFTLFVGRFCKEALIYAFEPIPPIFDLLRINADIYGLNVRLLKCGLSNRSITDRFTYYPHLSMMSGRFADPVQDREVVKQFELNKMLSPEDQRQTWDESLLDEVLSDRLTAEHFTCQLRTISDVLREYNIERIDLLKIDAQKAEKDVLDGIDEDDWSKIRQIVLEVHDIDGRLAQIIQMLERHGFEIALEQESLLEHTAMYDVYAVRPDNRRKHLTEPVADSPDESFMTYNSTGHLLDDVRRCLKESLGDHMTPSAFVLLEKLPITANGKLDRQALPAPTDIQTGARKECVPPQTQAEKILAEVWSQVLGIEAVSIHDNFFELGGDSILSIQINGRAIQAGLHLTPKMIFQYQTIAELAAVAETTNTISSDQGPETGQARLTPIQHWFFEQNFPDPHHFNQAILVELRQPLDAALLEQATHHLFLHHDSLRLRIVKGESGWRQYYAAPVQNIPLVKFDLSDLTKSKQAREVEARSAELQTSLNLSEGPLMRVALFNFGDCKPGRLLIVSHHLIIDGVSWRILLEDLETVYAQLSRGQTVALPSKTTSYKRWSERLNQYSQSAELQQEADYWLTELQKHAPPLPVDFPEGRTSYSIANARTISASLNVKETHSLVQEIPEIYRTQINEVLLTALAGAYERVSGHRSIKVDMEGHGREEVIEGVDVTRTVGWFTTIYPIVLELGDAGDIGERVRAIKEQVRGVPNRGIGYGILAYLSGEIGQRLRGMPQPQIRFNYLGQTDHSLRNSSLFGIARESAGPTQSPLARRPSLLEINCSVTEGRLCVHSTYYENVHHRATIERLAGAFVEELRAIINHGLSVDEVSYSPSDFPLAGISRQQLDKVITKLKRSR